MMFLPANTHRTAMELTGQTYAGENPLSKRFFKEKTGKHFNQEGTRIATNQAEE